MNKLEIAFIFALIALIYSNVSLVEGNSLLKEELKTASKATTVCKDTLKIKKDSYKKAIEKIKEIKKEASDAKCTLKSIRSGSFSFII